jgi:DNA polymerase-3 subunit epsilon
LEDLERQKITYLVIDFEGLTPAGRPAVPVEVAFLALTVAGDGLSGCSPVRSAWD